MVRTQLKSEEYFDQFVSKQHERIKKFENNITIGAIKPDRMGPVKAQIFEIALHIVIAGFSEGVPVNELKSDFEKAVTYFEEGWQDSGSTPEDDIHFDNYILILWMLSLGILFEVEDPVFNRIVQVLDKSKRRDYIFDFIIASRFSGREVDNKITYPKAFAFLTNLIKTHDVISLKQYLSNDWYKSMKLTYWYNNHTSNANSFFGYWSFESAVLVKILKLNDTVLKDQEYYPYDLVHWND